MQSGHSLNDINMTFRVTARLGINTEFVRGKTGLRRTVSCDNKKGRS